MEHMHRIGSAGALALAAAAGAFADTAYVRVTVENLAPANSIAFAPLRVGFHDGTYDYFDEGATANDALVSIAEGGSGAAFFPAFMDAQSDAVLGSVLPNPAGPLLPGATGSAVFAVDTVANSHFTFGSMAVPSNDYFIGNDAPMAHEVFDGNGAFVAQPILLRAWDLWDAGSEVDGLFGAAFVMGSSNDDHIDENGVVTADFKDLAVFNGSTTAAGYVFDSQLAPTTAVYRITIELLQPVTVRVMVENLAPENSVATAPLHVGFHDGVSYDYFNEGEMANAATVSIAEGGSGSAFFPAFMAAQPDAVLGTVLPRPAGPLLPGGTAMAEFEVHPVTNRYFTFGSMVVPSNDYFFGNDSPMAYPLFDDSGAFVGGTIPQYASDIWDAGSEVDGLFGAAFVMGSSNDDHVDEDGVVTRDFKDLAIFDGATTAAGYTFSLQLAADTEFYRISFELVPGCNGDLNGDATVDASDLGALLGQWGGTGPADLDGDGTVGPRDLGMLLGAWGDCG